MLGHSTREAAKRLRIGFSTLSQYISERKIPIPKLVRVGGVRVRLWSEDDIQKVRKILPKIANGRKGRYQKKASNRTNQEKSGKK